MRKLSISFLSIISIVGAFLFHPDLAHSQVPGRTAEKKADPMLELSRLTAKIYAVSKRDGELKVEVEVVNHSANLMYITGNPVGYKGSITSAIEFIKQENELCIFSNLREDPGICDRPFNSTGINFYPVPPKSSIIVSYRIGGPKIKIYPFCGFSYETNVDDIEIISVSLGYFESDEGLRDLLVKKRRFDQYDLYDIGPNIGERLIDIQKVVEMTYKLQ